ncbi:MAG: HAD family phosphatase [Chloroflexi bacterium]|nr:HAD family phosphatase [Chloroflexota bacterium]
MPDTTQRPISTVVFDLGGVLIDWDPRHLYRELFADPQEMEVFLRDVVSPDWNAEQDAGRTWAEATELLLRQYPDQAEMIQVYVDRWQDMLAGPIEGTVAILREVIDRGHRVLALTNWSAETFPRARGIFPFLAWFEGIVVSGDERVKKPDPEIWRRLIERYAVDPTAAVYIDDVPENARVAATFGFHAIRFESPEQLRSRLIELGVLPAV